MLIFLQAVKEAVVAKGMRGLMGLVPMADQIMDIADDVLERYRLANREAQLAEDLEHVVQADLAQIRQEVKAIVQETGSMNSEEKIQLEAYLTQLPGVARQSLKGPADPSGKTVSSSINLFNPLELARVLPARAPRFKIDEPVPNAPQWRFRELLGAGGFGEVWLAEHNFLEEQRAFKFCLDPLSRDRLLRYEGEVVKRLMKANLRSNHNEHGIVSLLDVYLEGETPWLAYEFVDGGDLASLVGELKQLSAPDRAREALSIVADLAEVVGRFHRLPQPIIHRDLKPANILLRRIGNRNLFRITDFGISHVAADHNLRSATISTPRLSLGETFRGAHTPIYASPQQKRGMKADPRDDVHALGIIAYQLLLADLNAERPAGKWRKRIANCQLSDATLDRLESYWDDDPEERPSDAIELANQIRQLLHPIQEAPRQVAPPVVNPTPQRQASESTWADVERDYELNRTYFGEKGSTKAWLEKRLERINRWQEAAERGSVAGMILFGECHLNGIGVPADNDQAIKWFQKAADLGDTIAMNLLGNMCYNGEGFKRNYEDAMKWYLKASAANDSIAMNSIGSLYYHGHGVTQSYPEAIKWYRKAAELNYSVAMDNVANLYYGGYGVTKDYHEALKWYRKAAELGNTSSINNLGNVHIHGHGVALDYQEALRWYHKGVERDDPNSMNNIGNLYYHGHGVAKDYQEALNWYQRAANLANATGMNNIGNLYYHGHGVNRDFGEAMQWYIKAAALNNEIAMNSLGWLYEKGEGVTRDLTLAREWYRKAVGAGSTEAQANLDRLKSLWGRLFG
jgi:TPR repeat protein